MKIEADEIIHQNYFTSKPFIEFQAKVLHVIEKAKGEISTGKIKRKLGRDLIDRWLADALKGLSGKLSHGARKRRISPSIRSA